MFAILYNYIFLHIDILIYLIINILFDFEDRRFYHSVTVSDWPVTQTFYIRINKISKKEKENLCCTANENKRATLPKNVSCCKLLVSNVCLQKITVSTTHRNHFTLGMCKILWANGALQPHNFFILLFFMKTIIHWNKQASCGWTHTLQTFFLYRFFFNPLKLYIIPKWDFQSL